MYRESPRPTFRLALVPHVGDYATWGLDSGLLVDGAPTGTRIPGYVIEQQYALDRGYLVVTSWDCPYEESLTLCLLGDAFDLLATADVGAPYCTGSFERASWPAPDVFEFSFFGRDRWRLRVRTAPGAAGLDLADVTP